jgi:hypothetical protein
MLTYEARRRYVIFVAASLGVLSSVYGDFMKAVGASARVFEVRALSASHHPYPVVPIRAIRTPATGYADR